MKIEVKSLGAGYGGRPVLEDFDFTLESGGIACVVGANGSGKSTFLRCLAGVLDFSGEIELDGEPLKKIPLRMLARRRAFLPQQSGCPSGLTVRELVEFGRFPYCGGWRSLSAADDAAVAEALERCGIAGLAERKLAQLSGGERRKVWIAMTLAQRPELLLLDEPTAFLDPAGRVVILRLLERLNREIGLTVVMALHDLRSVARIATRTAAVVDRRCRMLEPDELFSAAVMESVFHLSGDDVSWLFS
ncbi:MAG: ABC transporter ATP-binding protein [Victivallaceae bacterium]|nr:ABC transporter ATP-binding protein [Victivallaceae bacterium]